MNNNIITTSQLRKDLQFYKNPDTKIERLRKNGELYRIRRGLYVNDKSTPKEVYSSLIVGPSYVSLETALSRYDLIPEKVCECSCITFGKQRNTVHKNDLGYFSFTNIPLNAYPYGVDLYKRGDATWNMASPEKAICDLLYTRKHINSADDVMAFLFEGMRIEEDDFLGLDLNKMRELAKLFNHKNLRYLQEALNDIN